MTVKLPYQNATNCPFLRLFINQSATKRVTLTFMLGWKPFLIFQQFGVIFSRYCSSSLYCLTTIFNLINYYQHWTNNHKI